MITFRKSVDAHNALYHLNGREWNGSILKVSIKESVFYYAPCENFQEVGPKSHAQGFLTKEE